MSEIDRLDIHVQTQAQKANKDLDKMAAQLEKVGASLQSINTSGLSHLADGINRLSVSVRNMSTVKTADFSRIAKNIEKLGAVDQVGIKNTANSLRDISSSLTASTNLSTGSAHIIEFAKSLSKLGNKSTTKAITNIPLMANALKDLMRTLSSAPQVSRNLIDMTNALGNLASQGSKISSATKNINNSLNQNAKIAKQANANAKALTSSFSSLAAKLWVFRRAFTQVFSSVKKSMDFTETINLFETSFKKVGIDAAVKSGLEWGSEAANQFAIGFIDKAQSFTDKVSDALSVDPNTLMNYQAMFAQMSNAFGLTSGSVMNLSESFTMLGLDMASLFNTDVEVAMKKLQSGLAGETEPLRAWGVDITESTLKLTALKYGIEDTVTKMSQASKTQLRWLAIMDQTEVAFGDMAKTINSPANQLRILQQQWELLTKSIGNVFLPMVTKVLPYINGIVIALRRMIDTFATAMGFELPDYSGSEIYVDVTDSVADVGDAADDSTDSVNKLNKALSSLDQLNILSEGKSTKKSSTDLGSGYTELDDAINKKTTSYMQKFNEELGKMQSKAEEFADKVTPKIQGFIDTFEKVSPVLGGVAIAFATHKVASLFGGLATAIGAFNPATGVVFVAIAAIAAIYIAVKKYNKKLKEEDLAKRFGDIHLSLEDVQKVAEALTESDYTAKIDIYVTENQKLSEIESAIEKDIETLNKLNWKVSVGMALTEGDVEQYKSTIESFISNSEAYIEQQHYVTKLAINAVVQDDNFNAELTTLIDEYYNSSKGQLAELGKNLRAEMDNALADGVLDENERKVIDNLVKEINEVTESLADYDFKAKLNMITVEGKLSDDSFKDVTSKIQELIGDRIEKAEEAQYQILFALEANYQMEMKNATTKKQKDAIEKKYKQDLDKISVELSKTKSVITFDGMSFAYDTLTKNYSDGLDGAAKVLGQEVKDWLDEEWYDQYLYTSADETISGLVSDVRLMVEEGIQSSGLDSEARVGLEEMLKGLEPTSEDLDKIYQDALESGSQVEQGITDMLTADRTLDALSAGMDGVWFLMGQKLSTDEKFLEALEKSNTAGKTLNEEIIKGLKSKIPDLKLQGEKVIFNLDKAIKSAANTSKKENMPVYAGNMISGFGKTFSEDTTMSGYAKKWLSTIDEVIKNHKLPTMTQLVELKLESSGLQSTGIDVMDLNLSKYVKQYATGGIPNTGEMFIARENGIPEMVGSWGNKTAVANNGQITDGIASAVESAMANVLLPALSMIGGGGNVTVENKWIVDSEEMWKVSQKGKAKSERRYQTAALLN